MTMLVHVHESRGVKGQNDQRMENLYRMEYGISSSCVGRKNPPLAHR
jgi:hypothetical protein